MMTQSVQGLTRQAGGTVTSAIQKASSRTGVDFGYLMQQAKVESSFNPAAKASTSSATGLYQFVDSTWLDMINKYGDQYGLGKYAAQISENGTVANAQAKKSILALRKDPEISAYMAAEFAAENRRYLSSELGQSEASFGATDMYMAHFLGPGGAAQFLDAKQTSPMAAAADVMPQAARANKSIFYENGRALTVAEVYDNFAAKFAHVEGNGVNSVMYGTGKMAPATQMADTSNIVDPYARFWAQTNKGQVYAHQHVATSAGYADRAAATGNTANAGNPIPASLAGRYLVDPVQVAELASPEDGWSRFARATSSATSGDNRYDHARASRYNG